MYSQNVIGYLPLSFVWKRAIQTTNSKLIRVFITIIWEQCCYHIQGCIRKNHTEYEKWDDAILLELTLKYFAQMPQNSKDFCKIIIAPLHLNDCMSRHNAVCGSGFATNCQCQSILILTYAWTFLSSMVYTTHELFDMIYIYGFVVYLCMFS